MASITVRIFGIISQVGEIQHTPQLFSDEYQHEAETDLSQANEENTEELFDQDSNEEENFEIPAFLRKQKF